MNHLACVQKMKTAWILTIFIIATIMLIAYVLLLSSSGLQFSSYHLRMATAHNGSTNSTVLSCNITFFTQRYVLALSYWEQLTKATLNFFSLVHVAQYWGAHTVIPFTVDSELFGLPAANRRTLDVLFNIEEINTNLLCDKYHLPPLADFEDFMKMANRGIVFVHIAWNFQSLGLSNTDISGRKGINCSHRSRALDAGKSILQTLNNEADRMHVNNFSIINHCCINPYYPFTTGEFAATCGFADTNLTLIFDIWKGHRNHTKKNNFRLMFPGIQITDQPHCEADMFPCSEDIYSKATAFTQSFSQGKEFIAFHFRTTKLGLIGQTYTDTCMKKAFALRDNLAEAYPEIPIKYFVDYGSFGTRDGNANKKVIAYINNNSIVPLHYNPVEFGGLRDRGFVSLVEKSAIAKAKILVLIGGGSFQAELTMRMRAELTSERFYYICRDGSESQSSFDIHH